jgi:hypothetical protein
MILIIGLWPSPGALDLLALLLPGFPHWLGRHARLLRPLAGLRKQVALTEPRPPEGGREHGGPARQPGPSPGAADSPSAVRP